MKYLLAIVFGVAVWFLSGFILIAWLHVPFGDVFSLVIGGLAMGFSLGKFIPSPIKFSI